MFMKLQCLGRLTKKANITYTKENLAVAKFSIAINRGKDKEPQFYNMTAFGKTAEILNNYAEKGTLLYIEGTVNTSVYEKEETNIYKTELIAQKITLCSSPKNKEVE